MKKLVFVLLFLSLALLGFGQRSEHGRGVRYETDIFGNLQYRDRDGFKASLSKNIFDDIIYEDSNKNKLTYKKKFLDRLNERGEHRLFRDLLRYFSDKRQLQEEFEVDIFDNLVYKNNKQFKATFSRNIFKDVEYEDSNRNKIVYRQKFLGLFGLSELAGLDVYIFMDIFYAMMNENNYKEEYEVDIFDNVKYTSSDGTSIKVSKEEALRMSDRKRRDRNRSGWKHFF